MIDFSTIYEQVLNEILPEKNHRMSTRTEWRYGAKGSLSFNIQKGTWYDFETNESGGFLDLVSKWTFYDKPIDWLIENGHIPDTRGQKAKAALIESFDYVPVEAAKRDETYVYSTPEGEPLYRLIRTYNEQGQRHFKQERFDNDTGVWIGGLRDLDGNVLVEKTLFNLPELVNRPNDLVFIAEGEKCVNSLKSLGLLAVTSGGAKSWNDEFAQWFKSRDVIVLPDYDEAGASYADDVITSLKGYARSVKRVELSRYWTHCPTKGDISDFIASGGKLSDLTRMIEQTPFIEALNEGKSHVISFNDLLAHQAPPEWLIKGVLLKTGSTLLFAESGAGKSFLAIDWALHIACGKEWQGKKTKAGCVAFVAGEGVQGLRYRVKAWVNHHQHKPSDNGAFHVIGKGYAINEAVELNGLIADLDSLPTPPNLVVLDTLARTFSGDENHATAMGAYIKAVDFIRDRYQCSVLIIHHTGKADKATARGSNALKGAMDRELRLDANGDIKQVVDTKEKDGRGSFSFKFKLKDVDTGIIDDDGDRVTSAVVERTAETDDMSRQLPKPLIFALQTFTRVSDELNECDLSEWRDEFYQLHHGETVSAKKMAFNRARKDLIENGVMQVINDRYRLVENNAYGRFVYGILTASRLEKSQRMGANDDIFAMFDVC